MCVIRLPVYYFGRVVCDAGCKLNQLKGIAESCALPQSGSTRELIDAYLSRKVVDFLVEHMASSEINVQGQIWLVHYCY